MSTLQATPSDEALAQTDVETPKSFRERIAKFNSPSTPSSPAPLPTTPKRSLSRPLSVASIFSPQLSPQSPQNQQPPRRVSFVSPSSPNVSRPAILEQSPQQSQQSAIDARLIELLQEHIQSSKPQQLHEGSTLPNKLLNLVQAISSNKRILLLQILSNNSSNELILLLQTPEAIKALKTANRSILGTVLEACPISKDLFVEGHTMLHRAVSKDDVDVASYLLNSGASPHTQDQFTQQTPGHLIRSSEMLDLFLSRGLMLPPILFDVCNRPAFFAIVLRRITEPGWITSVIQRFARSQMQFGTILDTAGRTIVHHILSYAGLPVVDHVFPDQDPFGLSIRLGSSILTASDAVRATLELIRATQSYSDTTTFNALVLTPAAGSNNDHALHAFARLPWSKFHVFDDDANNKALLELLLTANLPETNGITMVNVLGETPLHVAVSNRDKLPVPDPIIDKLAKPRIVLEISNTRNQTVLHAAVMNGFENVVHRLLLCGSSVLVDHADQLFVLSFIQRNYAMLRDLVRSALNENVETTQQILSRPIMFPLNFSPNITINSFVPTSLLRKAIQLADTRMIELLLDLGALVEENDNAAILPLVRNILTSLNEPELQAMLDLETDKAIPSLVHEILTSFDDPELHAGIVATLLVHATPVQLQRFCSGLDSNQNSPLRRAIISANHELIDILLAADADLFEINTTKGSLFLEAVTSQASYPSLRLLLLDKLIGVASAIDPSRLFQVLNVSQPMPLITIALKEQDWALLTKLLTSGCRVLWSDDDEQDRNASMARFLFQSLTLPTHSAQLVLRILCAAAQQDQGSELLRQVLNQARNVTDGASILRTAVRTRNIESIYCLIERGALVVGDVDSTNAATLFHEVLRCFSNNISSPHSTKLELLALLCGVVTPSSTCETATDVLEALTMAKYVSQSDNADTTPLLLAIEDGDMDAVRILIEQGHADLRTRHIQTNRVALHSAVSHPIIVRYLLEKSDGNASLPADLFCADTAGATPMHLAIAHDEFESFGLLLHRQFHPPLQADSPEAQQLGSILECLCQHVITKQDWPHQEAAVAQVLEIVQQIFPAETVQTFQFGPKSWSLLHFAAVIDHVDLARWLVHQNEALLRILSSTKQTVLHVSKKTVATECFLQKPGAIQLLTMKDENDWSPCDAALERGDIDAFDSMHRLGGSVSQAALDRKFLRNPHILLELVKRWRLPGDVMLHDVNFGETSLLHWAAQNGQTDDIIRLVRQYGVPVDLYRQGWTALHTAANNHAFATVKTLVQLGAEIDATTDAGYTSLNLLCRSLAPFSALGGQMTVHHDLISYFVSHRADPFFMSNDGQSPLDRAEFLSQIYHDNTLLDLLRASPFVLTTRLPARVNLINHHAAAAVEQPNIVAQVVQHHIFLNRSNVVETMFDFFRQNQDLTASDILRFHFHGESGIDLGGIMSEAYTLFFTGIVQANRGLFERAEQGQQFLPCADADLSLMRYFGRWLARAGVVDKRPACVQFTSLILAHILHQPIHPTLSLMKDHDAMFAASLQALLTTDLDSQPFVWPDTDEIITNSNKATFVENQIMSKLVSTRLPQFEAIVEGFYDIINHSPTHMEWLASMNEEMPLLRDLLFGQELIKTADVVAKVRFREFAETSVTPTLFRQFVSSLNQEQLQRLLRFITGLDRLPLRSSNNIFIVCRPCSAPSSASSPLPSSHTCSWSVDMPDYGDAQLLAAKWNTALEMVFDLPFAFA